VPVYNRIENWVIENKSIPLNVGSDDNQNSREWCKEALNCFLIYIIWILYTGLIILLIATASPYAAILIAFAVIGYVISFFYFFILMIAYASKALNQFKLNPELKGRGLVNIVLASIFLFFVGLAILYYLKH
jgi:hypothetical protein